MAKTSCPNKYRIVQALGRSGLLEIRGRFQPMNAKTTIGPQKCFSHSPAIETNSRVVYIVDDNSAVRDAMQDLLEENGYRVEIFADGRNFLATHRQGRNGCVLIDLLTPGMSSVEFIEQLRKSGDATPAIVISRDASMSIAIEAKRHEAVDFIDKPVCCADLVSSVQRALGRPAETAEILKFRKLAELKVTGLTLRERQILDLILDGHSNKSIAADLGISQRTVEVHRAAIMKKIGTKNFAALVRTALCARCSLKDRGGS
jgi:two-component system, chemotaxis family, CheB/CheR fusion protein